MDMGILETAGRVIDEIRNYNAGNGLKPNIRRILPDEPPPRTPPPAPPVRDVVDPISALVAERELLASHLTDLASTKEAINNLPEFETNRAIASMHGGKDIVRRGREDAASVAAGKGIPDFGDSRAELCERKRAALEICIASSRSRITDLEALAGPKIYERDFAAKHRKTLRRIAAAMIELLAAVDAEEVVGREALAAGCFPSIEGFQRRPSLRIVNPSVMRRCVGMLRGAQIRKPEDLLD